MFCGQRAIALWNQISARGSSASGAMSCAHASHAAAGCDSSCRVRRANADSLPLRARFARNSVRRLSAISTLVLIRIIIYGQKRSRAVRTARLEMVAKERLELHGYARKVEPADRVERIRIDVAVDRVGLEDLGRLLV